jgi:hypothetical protein
MAAIVAAAWAIMAGCWRKLGQVTPGPTSPRVRSMAAVMKFQT